jgi:hypothetical protein
MTRDDVIRAAGEAGFHFHDAGFAPTLHTVPLEYSEKCFERFAAIIEAAATEKANELADQRVVAEREACAKACEEQERGAGDAMTFYVATGQCAAAIRARNQSAEAGGGK